MIVNYGLFENDFKFLIPELFLSISILSFVLYCVILNYNKILNKKRILIENIAKLSLITIIVTVFLYSNTISHTFVALNFQFVSNYFTHNIKIILLLSVFFTLFISLDYFKRENIANYEYILLILLSLLGMVFLISSNDFIALYLSLELMSLSFYILAASKTQSPFSTEAGLKYFILGALASCMFLFGVSFIYGLFGTTNFNNLALLFTNDLFVEGDNTLFDIVLYKSYLILPLILISVAFFFKVGAAPFHMWLPDVYEGSPTYITAFFSIVPKISIFGLFYKVFFKIFCIEETIFLTFCMILGILSLIVGSLGALYQVKLKRLFAYSAIAHTGFILLGFSSLTKSNLENFPLAYLGHSFINHSVAILFYLVIYILLSINIFSVILALRRWTNFTKVKHIGELKTLYKSNPLLAFIFAISLFSIAGVPPLVGFYGKLYIFYSLVENAVKTRIETFKNVLYTKVDSNVDNLIFLDNLNAYKYYIVVIVALLMSVVSALYYLRLIRIMFFNTTTPWMFYVPIDKPKALVLSYTFLLNMIFFVYPKPLILLLNTMAYNFYF